MAEEILVSVKIVGKDADKEINSLTKEINQLNAANKLLIDFNKKIVASGNQNSKAHIDNTKQIEINKQKINENSSARRGLISIIGAEDGSLKALRVRNAELVKQRDLISTKTEQGRAAIARLNKEIDTNNVQIKKNVSALEKQKINIGKYPKLFGDAAKAVVAFVAASGIARFIKSVIDITATFQKLAAVLTNTLGSRSAAQKSLKDISDFAAKTPFSVVELTDSFVKLANQGFKPTTEELRKLGDLASSQAKGFDQLTEAIIDAQTGEFERLKEFGIRAKKDGEIVTFTFKGVETQTKFTAKEIRNYVLSLGDLAGVSGSMAAISGTLSGKISNLGDNFDALLNFIGSRSAGLIGGILDLANNALGALNSSLSDNIGNLQTEQAEINALATAAINLNTPTEVRKALIDELNQKYPDFLGNLDAEKVTNEEIANRLKDVNEQFLRKIALVSAQQELQKVQDKITVSILKERDLRKEIEELKVKSLNTTGREQRAAQLGIEAKEADILRVTEKRKVAQDELISLTSDLTTALNIYSGASSDYFEQDASAVAEKEKVDQKAIDKALKARQKLNEELAKLQLEAFELELAQRQEFEELFGLVKSDANKSALDKISEDQKAFNDKSISEAKKAADAAIKIDAYKNKALIGGLALVTKERSAARIAGNAIFKQDAIKETYTNTYAAAVAAYKSLAAIPYVGPFLGAAAAAAVTLFGFSQIASIIGIQFAKGGIALAKRGMITMAERGGIWEMPRSGGVLRGPSHAQGGIPFSVGGRPGFEAEGGEAIINKRSTAMFKDELSAINQAGGGVAFATGGITGEETRVATRQAQQQIDVNQLGRVINQVRTVLVLEDFETKSNAVSSVQNRAKVI